MRGCGLIRPRIGTIGALVDAALNLRVPWSQLIILKLRRPENVRLLSTLTFLFLNNKGINCLPYITHMF